MALGAVHRPGRVRCRGAGPRYSLPVWLPAGQRAVTVFRLV